MPTIPQPKRTRTVIRSGWHAPSVGWSLWHERDAEPDSQTWWLRTPDGWLGPHWRGRALELLDAAARRVPDPPAWPSSSKPAEPAVLELEEVKLESGRTSRQLIIPGSGRALRPIARALRTGKPNKAKAKAEQLNLDLRQLGLPWVPR